MPTLLDLSPAELAQRLPALPEDELLGLLDAIAAELGPLEDRRTELYAQRMAIFREARGRVPCITQRVLAEHSGVTGVAIVRALNKDTEKRAKREAGNGHDPSA